MNGGREWGGRRTGGRKDLLVLEFHVGCEVSRQLLDE